MAAYGLYSHIQANKRRSVILLVGLFATVYLMVYAGALVAEALSYNASLNYLLRKAWLDLLAAAPWATAGTIVWIVIAYYFHQSMIDAVTGGHDVTRTEQPRLYNILENLCISRGIPMPKFKIIESDALNAFASGMNEKQYAITVTTGLLDRLDDAEIEAVLGHELTHIRNGDVRMMVIAVVIAGAISFFAEMFFRLWFYNGICFGSRRSSGEDRGRGGGGFAILIAVALIAVAWILSLLIRFALSRSREFLADAGAVELTNNPDAMISALRKIEGRGELPGATSAVMELCIDNPREGFSNLFSTREPRQGAGRDRRRPRSRADRAAAAGRAGARCVAAAARRSRPVGERRRCAGDASGAMGKHSGWLGAPGRAVGTISATAATDAAAAPSATPGPLLSAGPSSDQSWRARRPVGQARRVNNIRLRGPLPDPPPRAGKGVHTAIPGGEPQRPDGARAPSLGAKMLRSAPKSTLHGVVPRKNGRAAKITSPPLVKVMHRPVAVPHGQSIGGGDRGGDVILRRTHRGGEVLPLGEAGGDSGGERAAGAVRVLRRDACGDEAHRRRRGNEEVGALRRLAVPALHQHGARAEREQAPGLAHHLILGRRFRRIEQRGRLGQVRSYDDGERHEPRAHRFHRVGFEQAVARCRDHDRVEHDRRSAMRRQPFGHRLDDGRVPQHPDLHRADGEVGEHRVDLRAYEGRRHLEDRAYALGVLRGERRDHRGAVDAERRERLQVGLDTGAATGVGPRNGERDGCRRGRRRHAPTPVPW
jgi:heat shock protein HtpX